MPRRVALLVVALAGGACPFGGCGGGPGAAGATPVLPVSAVVGDVPTPDVRVEIELRRDGWLGLEGAGPLVLDALRARLEDRAARAAVDACGLPMLRPWLRADRGVRWDVVEGVLEACARARCARPSFAVAAVPDGAFAFDLPRDSCGPVTRTADWRVARVRACSGSTCLPRPGERVGGEAVVPLAADAATPSGPVLASRLAQAWATPVAPMETSSVIGVPVRRLVEVAPPGDATLQSVLTVVDVALRAGADEVVLRRGRSRDPDGAASLQAYVASAGPSWAFDAEVADVAAVLVTSGPPVTLPVPPRAAGPAGVRFEDGWVRPTFPARRAAPAGRRVVDPTVDWLVAHARPDGGWSAREPGRTCEGRELDAPTVDGEGSPDGDVGATALALLAFLGRGWTNRSEGAHGRVVGAGLRFLRNTQGPDGRFGERAPVGGQADEAIATLAFVEGYGMTGSTILRGPATRGLGAILAARRPDGAWGRAPGSATADERSTSWCLRALATAAAVDTADRAAGKPPSFVFPEGLRASVAAMLDDAGAPVDLATRATLRLALGVPREDDPWVARALAEVPADPPTADAVRADLERWWRWFALLRVTHRPPPSEAFEQALHRAVASLARTDGDVCGPRGSVDPDAACRGAGGRVAATAWAAMLESCTGCNAYESPPSWPPDPPPAPAADAPPR